MTILLKNADFIGIDRIQKGIDLGIDNKGMIIKTGPGLDKKDYEQELDLSGHFISPGWIDLHTHIYYGVSNLGVDPDIIGPQAGVSILVDAGSSGEVNFQGFRDYIIKSKDYPIYAFINVGSTGLMLSNLISELDTLDKLNIEQLILRINENREYIKGIKLRASGVILKGWGYEVVKIAKKVAEEVNLPLMVHVGEPLPLLEDILPILRKGDIVTHCYHGKKWGMFEKGRVIPEVWDALERGVRFDVGHGCASFNFEVAKKAISEGIKPFSISTDLHKDSITGPAWSLSLTMSKMLAIGLSLEEVIQCVTRNPASVLDEETYEDGLVGKKARFTIFSLINENIEAVDTNANKVVLNKIRIA